MTYGSLFTGAGLGDFGFELVGFECRWQVENDKYCRKILDLRWPKVKKYGDIKKIKTDKLEKVDLITGGFPCQPFSVAGKRVGEDDDRNLWPEMFRIIKDLKPRWVVAENVPGIIPIYLDTVLSDLENEGYECWPFVFSSHSLGAWHKRERLWIVGYTKSCDRRLSDKQWKDNLKFKRTSKTISDSSKLRPYNKKNKQKLEGTGSNKLLFEQSRNNETLADATTRRLQRSKPKDFGGNRKTQKEKSKQTSNVKGLRKTFANSLLRRQRTQKREISTRWDSIIYKNWWAIEPDVGRVVNGCAHRVDRLKALGNGQTPCSTFLIGQFIKEINNGS